MTKNEWGDKRWGLNINIASLMIDFPGMCVCVHRWMYRGFQIGITVECMGWWSWFCQTSCHPI